MDKYVTGKIIKQLRQQKNLKQSELAEMLYVSDKTISKWETGKGLPDISLIDSLAKALDVSTQYLLSGEFVLNQNQGGNLKKSNFYVCPICGNVIWSVGESEITCHGITLPKLTPELEDENHIIDVSKNDGELLVTVNHEMSKIHNISFIAFVKPDRTEIVKLYPEQDATVRFKWGRGIIYVYCKKDGFFKKEV